MDSWYLSFALDWVLAQAKRPLTTIRYGRIGNTSHTNAWVGTSGLGSQMSLGCLGLLAS